MRVLQVVDSLATGGAERVAITLANGLIGHIDASHLCATRTEGPLTGTVSADVGYVCLRRRRRIGFRALWALRSYVRDHEIDLIHAHGSSVYFSAVAISFLRQRPLLVWHDHNPRLKERSNRLARVGSMLARRVFVVSEQVRDWHVAAKSDPSRLKVFPNFVALTDGVVPAENLPGSPGERIVLVGNLRPEKNHLGTVRAFAELARHRPLAHLLLAGSLDNTVVLDAVRETAERLGVANQVIELGIREDVEALLLACDVGVLFSCAEGFPMALLEYGRAGLASVASDVGYVRSLADLTTGIVVVEPNDEAGLTSALLRLLQDTQGRAALGADFRETVERRFSDAAIIPEVLDEYRSLLGN